MRQRKETAYPKWARSSSRARGPPYAHDTTCPEDDSPGDSRQGSDGSHGVDSRHHDGHHWDENATRDVPHLETLTRLSMTERPASRCLVGSPNSLIG
jgi:hypothetical protein